MSEETLGVVVVGAIFAGLWLLWAIAKHINRFREIEVDIDRRRNALRQRNANGASRLVQGTHEDHPCG